MMEDGTMITDILVRIREDTEGDYVHYDVYKGESMQGACVLKREGHTPTAGYLFIGTRFLGPKKLRELTIFWPVAQPTPRGSPRLPADGSTKRACFPRARTAMQASRREDRAGRPSAAGS